jgi:hypothetical protein
MIKNGSFITKTTIQPCSWVLLNKSKDNLNIKKPETEDNMSLMLEIFDSLNTLKEKLNRLDYVIKRRNMELYISRKGKEEK